jgi:predicted lipoprotein with Yx(FWY)xxD motif
MRNRISRWLGIGVASLLLVTSLAPGALAAPSGQGTAALVQVASNAKLGSILVNAQGMTLYTLSSEAGGTLKCIGGCLTIWPPVTVPSGVTPPTSIAGASGTFGVITRSDNSTQQLTYNGLPLYVFSHDTAPGDTNGEGIQAFGGTWHAALAAATPLAAKAVERLVIQVTSTSGTVWGTVTARYVSNHRTVQKVCGKSSCQFRIPFGATVKLSQSATNAATWPFKQWQIATLLGQAKSKNVVHPSASIRMNASYRVKVVYVLG